MNGSDLILTMISAFLGALLSLFVSMLIENQRKPNLIFKIEDPPLDVQYPDGKPAKYVRFLRVQLWNEQLPKIFRWLDRNSAMHCNGFIQFHHYDGTPVFRDPMPLKWSGTGDPISIQILPDGNVVEILDPAKYQDTFWRSCYPGNKETIDIAARFDRDKECYGWSTDNYIHGWRNQNRRLSKGRYIVSVVVNTAGDKVIGIFKLENSTRRRDFRLLEASPDEIRKIRKSLS